MSIFHLHKKQGLGLLLLMVSTIACMFFYSANIFAQAQDNQSSKSNDSNRIDVQLKWRHQFQFAGYYAAIEKGFYQQRGLQVNLIERVPGPTPIDQLIFGEVDYAITGVGALVYRANGVPLVTLAAIFQRSPSVLISKFPALSDLKNKKVMLSRGVMNAEITAMLNKAGVKQGDFQVVPSNQSLGGFIGQEYAAYNAYVTNETQLLTNQNIPFYSFLPSDYGVNFYGDILLTTEKNIRNNADEVQQFREATLQGWQYAINHIDEMVELILAKYNSQNKSKAQLVFEANALIKLIHADIVPIGYMSKQRWQEISDVLISTGHIDNKHFDKEIDVDRFLYANYVKSDVMDFIVEYKKQLIGLIVVLVALTLVVHHIRLKRIISDKTKQLSKSKLQAEHDARTDILTGLANRRFCIETLEHDLSVAKRNDLALSLIYMDIDWFKAINDQYGHGAGDKVLSTLASILKNNVRSSDTPARFGGEEFVIVCLEKDKHSASKLAERIREEVEQTAILYDGKTIHITVSFGVASFDDGDTVDLLLKKSDQALYQAKESGRNKVVCL